jgi:hypothetical protein
MVGFKTFPLCFTCILSVVVMPASARICSYVNFIF